MARPTRALIDLDALRHNLACARRSAPASQIMAMVKADGYGHGLARVAGALEDAEGFGVASLEEALVIRGAGIARRILLLEGFFSANELEPIRRNGLDVVVHCEEQVRALESAHGARPISVWLKLDTGMHRLGFPPASFKDLWHRLNACSGAKKPIRVMTHLANADDREDFATRCQLDVFYAQVASVETELSIANSAGILGWSQSHTQWVRPGIMLYGISPFVGGIGSDEGLKPAMTLESRLMAVNMIEKGAAVGYGGTWVSPEAMPVGVVPVGYGDGYPRHAASGTPVLVNGRRVPLIGRVSMDMITVDLRAQPEARTGDPVVLWGRGLAVEEVAHYAGTIAYELVCRVAQRVSFVDELD